MVGAVGFLVDAGVLTAAMTLLGLNLYAGRVVSFLAAVTATWAMNRTFTFRPAASSSLIGEWLRFVASNAVGGVVNFGAYAWLVNDMTRAREFPVIAVAAGSLSGLAVNFCLSRRFVFRESPSTEPAPGRR
jgi:putative flippase GtrA